jgi:hypothetical protein
MATAAAEVYQNENKKKRGELIIKMGKRSVRPVYFIYFFSLSLLLSRSVDSWIDAPQTNNTLHCRHM